MKTNFHKKNFSLRLALKGTGMNSEKAYFHVAKSKRYVYFLQHRNLLRKNVVIAANHHNLQRNIVARQVARKMLPVLLGLYISSFSKITIWNFAFTLT